MKRRPASWFTACAVATVLTAAVWTPSYAKKQAKPAPHVYAESSYRFVRFGRQVEAPEGRTFIILKWRVQKEKHYLDMDPADFFLHGPDGEIYMPAVTDRITILKSGTGVLDLPFEVPASISQKKLKVSHRGGESFEISFHREDMRTSAELPCRWMIMDFEQEKMAERERMLEAFRSCMEECATTGGEGCLDQCRPLYPSF